MQNRKRCLSALAMPAAAAMLFLSCQTRHEVEMKPVEVKPIHITIDVNIRVDKALDDFFDEIDAADQ
jgi:2'-5' RNA ligase